MRRFVILAVALACGFGVQAQNEKDLERAGFVRDSIVAELAKHRANYAQNDSIREKLTPTILSLEKELVRSQAEYNKVLATITQRDASRVLTAYNEALKAAAVVKTEQPVVEEKREGETLADKYQALLADKQLDNKVKELVAEYLKKYEELLALHRQYMESPTKKESDNVAETFNAKKEEMKALETEISSQWHSYYFDRIYAYNLLMEGSENSAMLNLSNDLDAKSRHEIKEESGKYISDVLVDYFVRKKSLTKYEMAIATSLSLTASFEQLLASNTALENQNYRLAKLSLQQRNFIRYENIAVKKQSIYSASNPIPKTQVEDYGTVYRIRIGEYSKKMSISLLRGVVPVSYTYNDGTYTYFVGGFRTEQEAKVGESTLKKIGFKEPIIAVWVDGEYYSTLEEMHRYESQYNLEISGVATLTEEMKAKILSHKGDCSISRIGTTFVVGTFDGKSSAEAVATELKVLDSNVVVKISKKTN